MIRHDNESAEVNATVFHRETECGDNDRACFWIENWSLWMQ
jgi:hypothetical protein